MKLVKLECEHCGAALEIDLDNGQACCPYCGSRLMLDGQTVESMQATRRAQMKEDAYMKRVEMEYAYRNKVNDQAQAITVNVMKVFAFFFFAVFAFIIFQWIRISFM